GDHERVKHFVPKDKLTEAMINGTPVVALCGQDWVPSRNPERFPMCPACQAIRDGLGSDDDPEESVKGSGFHGDGRKKYVRSITNIGHPTWWSIFVCLHHQTDPKGGWLITYE